MLSFLDFKIPEDNWDESNSSDMDSYGSDCDDIMSGNKIVIERIGGGDLKRVAYKQFDVLYLLRSLVMCVDTFGICCVPPKNL